MKTQALNKYRLEFSVWDFISGLSLIAEKNGLVSGSPIR